MLSFLSVSLFCCSQSRLLLKHQSNILPQQLCFPFFLCTHSPFNAFLYYNLSLSPLHLIASFSPPSTPTRPFRCLRSFSFSLVSFHSHALLLVTGNPPPSFLYFLSFTSILFLALSSLSRPPPPSRLRDGNHTMPVKAERRGERRGSGIVPILHSFHTSASEDARGSSAMIGRWKRWRHLSNAGKGETVSKCTGRTLVRTLVTSIHV